jgi:hypothetical protein
MKVRNVLLKVVSVVALAAVLFAAMALLDRGRVSAFNPQPDPPAFGMIGITNEQTARLNVVNVGEVQPGRVQVELMFLDGQGNVLRRSTETLMPGRATFLDLDGATLPRDSGPPSAGGNRTQIRAKIRLVEDPNLTPIPIGDRNLAATVEVFDNFGLDAGKSRMGFNNHNETLLRDRARRRPATNHIARRNP